MVHDLSAGSDGGAQAVARRCAAQGSGIQKLKKFGAPCFSERERTTAN